MDKIPTYTHTLSEEDRTTGVERETHSATEMCHLSFDQGFFDQGSFDQGFSTMSLTYLTLGLQCCHVSAVTI